MNNNLIGIIASLLVIIITLLILYFKSINTGSSSESCLCPQYYGPVCGSDGKTYDNECFAKCARVTIQKSGVC